MKIQVVSPFLVKLCYGKKDAKYGCNLLLSSLNITKEIKIIQYMQDVCRNTNSKKTAKCSI